MARINEAVGKLAKRASVSVPILQTQLNPNVDPEFRRALELEQIADLLEALDAKPEKATAEPTAKAEGKEK
jgi:hypothetical protein